MNNLLTILFFFVSTTLLAQENETFKVLPPAEYKKEVNQQAIQFVDIRTPEEFEEGSIEGAENIDFLAEGFLSKMAKFKKEEPLYIYCRSGNRTSKAAAKLSEIGFENIIDLEGGYISWKEFEEK